MRVPRDYWIPACAGMTARRNIGISGYALTKVAGVLLVMVLGWNIPGAWSQEAPEPNVDSSAESGTAERPEPTPRTATPVPDPIDETSPFDYQASEEISQDRSVSFPVDI